MPTRTFAITADDKPVALDSQGAGELTINVSNTTAKPIRGQAKLVPLGTTKLEWLRINGEVERNFSANEAHQFVVRMTAPAGTPGGKYSLRLNVVSVQNPDDDFAEGPAVAFEVREAQPLPPPNGKKFPWFFIILAIILIGGGVAVAMMLTKKAHVPPLVGKDLNSVTNEIAEAGLELTNVTVVVFDQTTNAPGKVFEQVPPAETKVKPGSGVSVKVAEVQSTVKVPSVVRMKVSAAINTLAAAKLLVTNTVQVPTTNSRDWEIVLTQNPMPGQPAAAFSPVTLSVGVQKTVLHAPWQLRGTRVLMATNMLRRVP